MDNTIELETNQDAFTNEIERVFTRGSAAVNVSNAKITVVRGSPNGYGTIEVKGSSKINVSALNMKLSSHYVANITLVGQNVAKLQLCPD